MWKKLKPVLVKIFKEAFESIILEKVKQRFLERETWMLAELSEVKTYSFKMEGESESSEYYKKEDMVKLISGLSEPVQE